MSFVTASLSTYAVSPDKFSQTNSYLQAPFAQINFGFNLTRTDVITDSYRKLKHPSQYSLELNRLTQ